MRKYKVGDELEIKLRVKVIDNKLKSPKNYLEVETITDGIWETICDTLIIENQAVDRILTDEN